MSARDSLIRIIALADKEWIQVRRDLRSLILSIMLPVLLLLLFGYALNMDVNRVSTAVYDQDKSPLSREIVDKLSHTEYLSVNRYLESYGEIDDLIDRGEIILAVVIPPSFGKNHATGKRADIQLIIDGSDSTSAMVASGYVKAILFNLNQERKLDEARKAYIAETPQPEFILNLGYRQGPEIPSLEGACGFADSNFICFQYETRRTGIYAAGGVRQPMNMAEAIEDGAGAAFKAIQCLDHVARGIAVHPRAWDATFPDPLMIKCTSCKRCTEECPFGAIDEDEKGTPFYKINRCRRCGTCMGACPERIVSFKDFSVDIVGSMIKGIEVTEDEFRIVVLACENDAYPALDSIGVRRGKINPNVRIIPVRCLGSTNLVWVTDAFSKGIDGLMLLGCKYGENYQCHFVKGSELANYRFSKVKETLDKLQLESDRVQLIQVAINEYDKLPDIINDFVSRVEEIGPNPFKEF